MYTVAKCNNKIKHFEAENINFWYYYY